MDKKKIMILIGSLICLILWISHPVYALEAQDEYMRDLKEQMDFTQLDELLKDSMSAGDEKVTFSGLVDDLLEDGISGFDGSEILDWIFDAFFYEIESNRKFLIEVVLIAAAFSILKNFTGVFRLAHVSQLSFMLVYCVLGVMLLKSFANFNVLAENALQKSIDFMRALIPAVSLTLVFSTGTGTSAGFYQIAFLSIYLIQWVFLKFLMPGIRVYVVLELFDHFFEDMKFSSLADLIKSVISWTMKLSCGVVLGLNVVQSLIAPAKDHFFYGTASRAASMIPGVGNTVKGFSEILFASGVLIKNCVGVAALLFLLAIGMMPMFKMAVLSFFYKIAAAVSEPIADKRMIGCLKGMAKGGKLYFKLTGYSLALFFLTIALTTAVSIS